MLKKLGDCPSDQELGVVAAVRAEKAVNETFSAELNVHDRGKWKNIAEFTKEDLLVGQHLGMGTFSDVFEVTATVEEDEAQTKEGFAADAGDLDKRIEAKFSNWLGAGLGADLPVPWQLTRRSTTPDDHALSKRELSELWKFRALQEDYTPSIRELGELRTLRAQDKAEEGDGDDMDRQIEAMFTGKKRTVSFHQISPHQSVVIAPGKRAERRVTLAMKCLRPQIRSDSRQFKVGIEDLVDETAMLASLDHPNIVKIHGRAGGCAANSFCNSVKLSDGFFVLLDRLKDTLDDRVRRWKKINPKGRPPTPSQVQTAASLADALAYLHTKKICFRDLKPANVGFDSLGVLKLFDFGFAVEIELLEADKSAGSSSTGASREKRLLDDECRTPRYMAPEVGLMQDYALPADVYSFGIILWEICALTKPFGKIFSKADFRKSVERGARPKVAKAWPPVLKDLITSCWPTAPAYRPGMKRVKSVLEAHAKELQRSPQGPRRKSMLRRLSFTRGSLTKCDILGISSLTKELEAGRNCKSERC